MKKKPKKEKCKDCGSKIDRPMVWKEFCKTFHKIGLNALKNSDHDFKDPMELAEGVLALMEDMFEKRYLYKPEGK